MSTFSADDLLLAPLAGYTDLPFRRSCRRQGLRLAYTALIDAGALVYGNDENEAILARGDDEPWLGVQLLGSRLELLEAAAPMLLERPYDEFNFNLGCPVKKVQQRGSGAALLKDASHARDCVRLLRRIWAGRRFTVKLRVLDAEDPSPTVAFCRMLVEEGVEALTIHGRLASKVYSGPVAMDVIGAVREAVPVPVAANGGIFSLADAEALAAGTGCRQVMVARGAIGNPWLFRELLTGTASPTHGELCDTMEEHLDSMMRLYGDYPALVAGRKILLGYLSGRGYHRSLKLQASVIATVGEFADFMRTLRGQRGPDEPAGRLG